MRLYEDNTESYIRTLAATVSKDPASLENWRCLHLSIPVQEVDIPATLRTLRENHKVIDCDLIHCPDGDILIISRALSIPELFELAEELAETLILEETISYDLFRDWREVRALLTAKTPQHPEDAGTAEASPSSSPSLSPSAVPGQAEEDRIELPYNGLDEVFAAMASERSSRRPTQVMLVEDDPFTRRLVSNALKEQYALITANGAEEALTRYLLHAPDIVFLDIGLPDVSGFTVLKEIVAHDPQAYVVMFSGNSYLDNVNLALEAGAAGFIAKPFRREKMEHYIADSQLHHQKAAMT